MRAQLITGALVVALAGALYWSIQNGATEKAARQQAEQAITSMSLAMQERERQYNRQQQVIAVNRSERRQIQNEIEVIRNANREELSTDSCADALVPVSVNRRLQQLTAPD